MHGIGKTKDFGRIIRKIEILSLHEFQHMLQKLLYAPARKMIEAFDKVLF